MSMSQKDISNQVISMDKEYMTRDGRKVEILTISRNHQFNVVSLIEGCIVETHVANGKNYDCENVSWADLVEVTKIEEGLKEHDLVMVSLNGKDWNLRFFSHYTTGGSFAFNNGHYEGCAAHWEYCRKATPQEIIAKKDILGWGLACG